MRKTIKIPAGLFLTLLRNRVDFSLVKSFKDIETMFGTDDIEINYWEKEKMSKIKVLKPKYPKEIKVFPTSSLPVDIKKGKEKFVSAKLLKKAIKNEKNKSSHRKIH